MALIYVRSAVFHVLFYVNCTLWFVVAIVAWPFPSTVMLQFARWWAISNLYLHECVTGAEVEIRGMEHIPAGPYMVAAKHQSAWETMALLAFFPLPSYILKRELLWVPLFGWHLMRAGQVAINRSDKRKAMSAITTATTKAYVAGRQILIFPEGTRRKVGAPPDYRYGVAKIYEGLREARCLPVAIVSGLAWPRNTLLHYPRKILVEFLPPIPAGLPTEDFFRQIQKVIEENTDRLAAEAGYRAESAEPSQSRA
ncbi:PlsC 1-acyl-sn-glycerol-3-phosphate acyltransferase [Rhabdaerophilaceae bacterium]